MDRYIVHLIDTPGFDDTHKSDAETLEEVATWLAATYRSQIRLTGILYLQRITDNRFGGCALLNLKMFKKMCGEDCLPNVVLLTTMWGGSEEQIRLQQARELELISDNKLWAGLIRLGARTMRWDRTEQTEIDIVKEIMNRPQIVLEIQRQIVDEGMNLHQTAAGIQLREEITKKEQEHQAELHEVREDMERALKSKNDQLAEELKKAANQLEDKLNKMELDKERLQVDLQKQLQQHQTILQHMTVQQNMKLAIFGGIAVGALTGGLGLLVGMGLAGGTTAAIGSLAALPVGQIAGELGRRALMSATHGAIELGTSLLESEGPRLAAGAISSLIER